MPDGPISVDSYCGLEGGFHQDVFWGSKICSEKETAMLQQTEFRSHMCVGLTSMGRSYFFECSQDPCPSNVATTNAGTLIRHTLFLGGHPEEPEDPSME